VDPNPNPIRPQAVAVRWAASPQVVAQASCVPMGPVGYSLDGVAIFNGLDAQGRDAVAYEVQDACAGHPQQQGLYHYHGFSPCLHQQAQFGEVLGFALDGFPILGPKTNDGHWIQNAELDECHGQYGPVNIGGTTVMTYHYRFTREYPYTVGCYRGTVL
jgi:hypothetical protein